MLLQPRQDRQPTFVNRIVTPSPWIRQIYAAQHDLEGEWMWSRNQRKGASSIASCCALNKHSDAHHEWIKDFDRGYDEEKWKFPASIEAASGTRRECVARTLYEVQSGNSTFETGLWLNSECTARHSSPDGIVYNCVARLETVHDLPWGLLEIKCPYYVFYESIPIGYALQMQQQMWSLNASWVDFYVYLHSSGEYRLLRLYRSDEWIDWMAACFYRYTAMESAERCQRDMSSLYFYVAEMGITSTNPEAKYDFEQHSKTFMKWPRTYINVYDAKKRCERPAPTATFLKASLPSRPMLVKHLFEGTLVVTPKQRDGDVHDVGTWKSVKLLF